MEPTLTTSMIGRNIGHYCIRDQIGSGGMGVIYRARDEHLKRDVALKLLPPNTLSNLVSRQRFRREALALSRLNHPAVAVLHDFISEPDCDCIVMELIAGESLDRRISRGALPEREAVRLAMQLADGLSAAHRVGVIHRDLKPANLTITTEGRLKILDFGLAKRVDSRSTVTELVTDPKVVLGTLPYIAPEMWRGEQASEASDLYATGIVLYEMATGTRPFPDLHGGALEHAALNLQPMPPRKRNPSLSEDFERIIRRCLEKSPRDRYGSAHELHAALEALHSKLQTPASPRRVALAVLPWPVWLGGTVVLGLGAAAALVSWSGFWSSPARHIRSLAVLPLANLTGDASQEYFADGMTDELIQRLAEYPDLRVISRTSMMRYKETSKTLPAIARELGVEGVVQGKVEIIGDGVRLSVQLIDGRQDRQLWSYRYGGDRRDAPDIQQRMAQSIAREVGLRLDGAQSAERPIAHQVDPVAYQHYLQGRFHWNRRSEDGIRRAIRYFDSAIRRDSLYAPAYSGLADAWGQAGLTGIVPPTEAHRHAKQAAARALALDAQLSDGYVSMAGILQNFEWDWDGAAEAFRKAIALNDNNATAHHWYANHLALRGDFKGAMLEIRHAQDLDPLSLPIGIGAGAFQYFARHYEEALAEYRRVAELDSTSGMLQRAMAANYDRLGREADAVQAVLRWLSIQYTPSLAAQAERAHAAGGFPGLLKLLIRGLIAKRQSGLYEPATHVAELYSRLGDRDQAFRWLEIAVREHDTELNRLKVDPIFDPLRDDGRFLPLVRKVGLSLGA